MIKFERPAIQTGDLNKPIRFYEIQVASGPEQGGGGKVTLFEAMAEVYESSMKDIEAHSTVSSRDMITVKIRDTYGEYLPQTDHEFEIDHHHYPGEYRIIDVAPDNRDRGFIKIVGEWHE